MSANWTESAVAGLPPNKRYILTHDPSGKSIVHSSPPQLFRSTPLGGVARSYATATTPAILKDDTDIPAYLSPDASSPTSHKGTDIVIPTHKGSNIMVIDLVPGAVGQMHRTVSIDYSICVIGLVCMDLDNGETVELRPGDHVIQRGTLHKWYNGSQTEPARFIAVTLPCEAFELPGTGKMLAEERF